MNLFHKKDIGILQFGRSNLQRDDDDKRMAKLKEYSNPSDNLLSDILSAGDLNLGNGGKKTSKSQISVNKESKTVENARVGVNYDF